MKNNYFSATVKNFRTAIIVFILFLVSAFTLKAQTNVTLTPIADNGLYFGDPGKNYGAYSPMSIIQGSSTLSRPLVKFDLTGIPSNAVITSATLTLVKNGWDSNAMNIATHQITSSWTEGTGGWKGSNEASNWNQRIPSTNWTTPGGDYNSTAETSITVTNDGSYSWSIPVMAQNWVTTPSSNHGVLLKSTTEGGSNYQHDFITREGTVVTNRPKLVVTYTTAPTIATSAISPITYCSGDAVSVPFTITGTFTGGNVFTAQLSDASSSFAAPVSIGTLNSTTAGTIAASIPSGTITGMGYRIRVVSSTPVITGTKNGSDITVNAIPTITDTTPASRCGTGTVDLGATASAGTINWYANSTGGSSLATGTSFTTPSISATTIYWVDATSNGCTTASRTAVTATITKNYWNGVANTDWNNPANWCAGVPTNGVLPTLDVVIPSGLINYPIISAGDLAGYVKTLVLENNTTLNIMDNSLQVTDNLKLDGKIDLEGESQLLQDLESALDPTSSGTLERDQQGTADTYTYNYWSSPVSKINTSSNNLNYNVKDVFKDVNFLTSGYNGTAGSPIGIADYWIWKFSNKTSGDYSQWQHVRSTGTILVGEGFTMKGPGTGSIPALQNYVFEGKPNNGDINITVSTGNNYLIGNPYPSAIDANQFILDNEAVIGGTGSTTGTLYFWQHWGGGSHILKEYQGGYGTYTIAGAAPAPFIGVPPPGLLNKPGRYIPVAQGFFVVAETSGTIKFNNGQRVFQAEGTNSVFVKSANTKNTEVSANDNNTDTRLKLRLGFNSVNKLHRQLLVTADSLTTSGYDRGYDALNIDAQMDDMYWLIDADKYVIQATDQITDATILPIGIHVKNDGKNSITIDKLENTPDNLIVLVHDKELHSYHNLRQGDFEVFLLAGDYLNRFEITFAYTNALGVNDVNNMSIIDVLYSNEKHSIIIQNPDSKEIRSVEMYNVLGQTILKFETNSHKNYLEYSTSQIKTGAYVLKIETEFGKLSKKVLIN